jgi:Tfp pilus assembly protein PilO
LVTVSLAAAGCLYLLVSFLPTSRAIRAIRVEIRDDEAYIEQAASLAKSIAQTEAELNRTREYSETFCQRLPTRSTFSSLLGRITKQADIAGASTTRIEPQTAADLDTLRLVPVVYKAKGSFADLSRLLAGLEGLPERIWLDDVRLTAKPEAGQKMECELKLVVFAGISESSD